MFDRDTELASNSAVSFNNEDEAEELALARLEAELRALEVEEEALAREEVEEEKAEAVAAEREDQAVASLSSELRAHEELMKSCSLNQLAVHEELALTMLKDAIALGGEFDDKLRQEANKHQAYLEQRQSHCGFYLKPKKMKDAVIARVIVALQLATQLTSLVISLRSSRCASVPPAACTWS